MYKEIAISIAIIVAIFSVDFLLQHYTNTHMQSMMNELQGLKQDLQSKDTEKINASISDVNESWDKMSKNMAVYIEHDELEKVKTDLASLNGYIEAEDYDSSLSDVNKTSYILDHIKRKYGFSLANVF